MTHEQGLVERLRARPLVLYPQEGDTDPWAGLFAMLDTAADALEAQSTQIAELQAEVEDTKATVQLLVKQNKNQMEHDGGLIADLKRALDTARLDAMDAARYRWLRNQRWYEGTVAVVSEPKHNVKLGSYCPSDKQLDEVIDAALSLSASPLSQGGQE
jgi:hypothetical protein